MINLPLAESGIIVLYCGRSVGGISCSVEIFLLIVRVLLSKSLICNSYMILCLFLSIL
jgi:hypothetical protein